MCELLITYKTFVIFSRKNHFVINLAIMFDYFFFTKCEADSKAAKLLPGSAFGRLLLWQFSVVLAVHLISP